MHKQANDFRSTDLLDVFKVLSDLTRFRIVKLLFEVEWFYVCELSDILDIPFYGISRHLKELKRLGIVREEKEGRFVKYFLVRGSSNLEKKLWELIALVEDDITEKDRKQRQKRLSLRQKGECSLCVNVEEKSYTDKEDKL
ncbi:MAG: ArsR/SmtB family transcription factor [Brevinematales bacterium]